MSVCLTLHFPYAGRTSVQAESNCSPQDPSRLDMSIIYIKLNEMLTKDVSNLTGEKLPWAIQP